MNVYVLALSEVENVLLLSKPFLAIAKLMQFDSATADKKLTALSDYVLKEAAADTERYATDATRRHIDAAMKKIGLSSKLITDLTKEFREKAAQIDPAAIHSAVRKEFDEAITAKNFSKVLRLYDNKGLLAAAAKILGFKGRKELEEFIGRVLRNGSASDLLAALKAELPAVKI